MITKIGKNAKLPIHVNANERRELRRVAAALLGSSRKLKSLGRLCLNFASQGSQLYQEELQLGYFAPGQWLTPQCAGKRRVNISIRPHLKTPNDDPKRH